MDCTIYVAKTKALIGCAVTAQLICVFFLHMQNVGSLMTRLISGFKFVIRVPTNILINRSIDKVYG